MVIWLHICGNIVLCYTLTRYIVIELKTRFTKPNRFIFTDSVLYYCIHDGHKLIEHKKGFIMRNYIAKCGSSYDYIIVNHTKVPFVYKYSMWHPFAILKISHGKISFCHKLVSMFSFIKQNAVLIRHFNARIDFGSVKLQILSFRKSPCTKIQAWKVRWFCWPWENIFVK